MLDVLGSFSSLLATYYFIRLNNRAWVVSLLAIILNGCLYWQKAIYGDMALESFYFFSTCYGWYCWSERSQQNLTILRLNKKQILWTPLAVLIIYALIVNLLIRFTDSNIAVLDALTTSLSLVAQGLMCYKLIATWILWFIADALYAYIYLCKKLPFHCLLMLIYTVLAGLGYLQWKKL